MQPYVPEAPANKPKFRRVSALTTATTEMNRNNFANVINNERASSLPRVYASTLALHDRGRVMLFKPDRLQFQDPAWMHDKQHMATQFRRYAEMCVEMAKRMSVVENRERMMEMAERFLQLAKEEAKAE